MERPESERSDWTDQDLLTVDEAVQRVDEAIAEVTTELESMDNSGSAHADDPSREALRARLRALRASRDTIAG